MIRTPRCIVCERRTAAVDFLCTECGEAYDRFSGRNANVPSPMKSMRWAAGRARRLLKREQKGREELARNAGYRSGFRAASGEDLNLAPGLKEVVARDRRRRGIEELLTGNATGTPRRGAADPYEHGSPAARRDRRLMNLLRAVARGDCPRASRNEFETLARLEGVGPLLQHESAHGADTSGGWILTALRSHHGAGKELAAAAKKWLADRGQTVAKPRALRYETVPIRVKSITITED